MNEEVFAEAGVHSAKMLFSLLGLILGCGLIAALWMMFVSGVNHLTRKGSPAGWDEEG